MNFVFVFADKPQEYNTSEYRAFRPARALSKKGHGVSLVPIQLFSENSKDAEELCNNANIIVVERNYVGDTLTRMAYYKVRGKIIALTFDDGYHATTDDNISYTFWKEGTIKVKEDDVEKTMHIYPHPFEQFTWGLKLGHFACLPSKELIKYYEKYLPCYYFPNYFETANYINIPKQETKDIIIGWGGSVSHLLSFRDSGILGALKNVCEVRSNVKIKICGDKRVLDIIEVKDDQKIFHPYVPHNEWPKILNTFSIGIAPLANLYDTYRSNIKPVEYCLTKIPWLASNEVAYNELSSYGKLVNNTVDEWTVALLNMIDNLVEEKEKAKGEPYQFGLAQDVDNNVDAMIDSYKELAKKHAYIDFG